MPADVADDVGATDGPRLDQQRQAAEADADRAPVRA
jgi:hypothetical protein